MEDFSTTFPAKPEDFEEMFGVSGPAIFSPEEWNKRNPTNPLVSIEDAESYVICYVPLSRADAVLQLLHAGAKARAAMTPEERELEEQQRAALRGLLFGGNVDG
jgi:hypothetical protein